MNDTAPLRRIWLCADDYAIAEGVNRAIRDLIGRGRLNATSVMVVGAAIGRDEVASLQDAAGKSPRCAIGLHVTLTAPFRPLTIHFRPTDGGMFLPFPQLLRSGLLRRLDPEMIREVLDVMAELSAEGMTSIVVTHEMGFARRAADRIVFMESGEIIESASCEQFFGGKVNDRSRRFLDQILH